MIPKASLYDKYQLSNSTAIPLYEGSTGPEAIQVGQYMQGLYDQASEGAGAISSASDNIQSMTADKSLAEDLRNNVQGKIQQWSSAKDWENHLPEVKSLGREYANRAGELAKPVAQYQEWKKTLDDKDLNLTPEHKASLDAMALSGYTGLRKDHMGRYVGSFNGLGVAKNVDYNEKVDKWMKDIAIQKGGSEIANFNGAWKIKRGSKWESLEPGTIERTLNYAMANDNEFNSSVNQDASISAFHGVRSIKSLDQLTPSMKMDVAAGMAKGYDLKTSLNDALVNNKRNQIMNTAKGYAITKYTYHKRENSSDVDFNEGIAKQEQTNQLGMWGDAVTDVGVDLAAKYGSADNIETTQKATTENMDKASTELKATRQLIAKSLGTTEDKLSDAQVSDYYTKNDPAGLGAYKAKQQVVAGGQQTLDELNQIRNRAMDLASRKKTGMTFDELNNLFDVLISQSQ